VVQNKRIKRRDSSNTFTAFNRLSIQLVCSCRHKCCIQHAVCTAGVQLQTQVLSSIDSVQLVCSRIHKYCIQQAVCTAVVQLQIQVVFNRPSVQLVCSCSHKYCLQHAVCTAGVQLKSQVLPSTCCLYSWCAAADPCAVFNILPARLVCSFRQNSSSTGCL
jgi:hypothetical protein